MKLKTPPFFVAIAVIVFLTRVATAAILIGNYPGANDSTFSTIASTSGSLSKAAGFTLPIGSNYHLESILVRLNVNDASSSVSFSLFGDVGGNPGGPALLTFTTRPLISGVGDYTLTPSTSFLLQNLGSYWIAATGVSSTVNGVTWLASDPGVTPSGVAMSAGFRSDSSGAYPPARISTIQNTYEVSATIVPEPSSLTFALFSSAGLLLFSRYRQV